MPENGMNIYKSARRSAGLTQEGAAACLHVSVESLKRYETGRQRPPDDVVAGMCDLYECLGLAVQHLRESSALGRMVLPEVSHCDLQTATIRLVNRVLCFAEKHRDRQLLMIAEDGVIDDNERPLFDAILADMEQLVAACTEVKLAQEAQNYGKA